MPSIEDL